MDMSDSYRYKEVYRGHNRTPHVNYARTDKRKQYWLNRIVTYWNDLDMGGAIVNAGDPLVFKIGEECQCYWQRGINCVYNLCCLGLFLLCYVLEINK